MEQKRVPPRRPIQPSRGGQKNVPTSILIMGGLLVVGLILFLSFPTLFSLLWVGLAGWGLYQALKKEGMLKTNVENKLDIDWKEAKDKFIRHVKAEDMMEEKIHPHPHTPLDYSYDKCARDKRLEQIKTLRQAGLIDEAEYKKRRQDIMAGK